MESVIRRFQNGNAEFHIFKETNHQLTLTYIPVIRKLANTVIMEVLDNERIGTKNNGEWN